MIWYKAQLSMFENIFISAILRIEMFFFATNLPNSKSYMVIESVTFLI